MREIPTIEEPVPVLDLSPEEIEGLTAEVRARAAERNAVILAHNYQVPEIQDLADFVGDSLELSRRAAATDAELIVFCGVHFMAETASILAPDKTVLIPDLEAGCSLAESITANELRNWKQRYPQAVVVMYVNTSAEVKAETDYCCTSANAVAVVEHVRAEHGEDAQILFGPDMWLGTYVERVTGRSMIVWPGECHVHAGIRPEHINRMRSERPESEVLIHPECGSATQCTECGSATQCMEYVIAGEIADGGLHMLGTGGMLKHVREHPDGDFVVATETGMLHPLRKAAPRARLTPVNRKAVCKYMKTITLPKLRDSLRHERFEVKVPDEIAQRARVPIERMVAIS
jgi:quinolinate synthase